MRHSVLINLVGPEFLAASDGALKPCPERCLLADAILVTLLKKRPPNPDPNSSAIAIAYNASFGAIIHFNTPRDCTPKSNKSIRAIAPFLKSTRNSGVPGKYPVNELICGSCPTNSRLGSRRNARTSAHVSIGDAIGVSFADGDNSSS